MKKSVLIIDDSALSRTILRKFLTNVGLEVIAEAGSAEESFHLTMELKPDWITLDNILPDMMGTDLLKLLKKENISSKIIIISAIGQQNIIDECLALGVQNYIIKPITFEQIQLATKT